MSPKWGLAVDVSLLPRTPNANNMKGIAIDYEQYPVAMPRTAIKQSAHLKGNRGIFRRERATQGKTGKRPYGFFQSLKPA